MDNEKKEIDVTSKMPVANNKKKDYVRYILAAVCLILAGIFYVRDINKKQIEQAVQADLNFIHYLVSEENTINSVDMIIDIENESKVNIMIPCSEEERKAITEALAKAETTDFLEEQREGKLFTIFLNCNNNARFCIEAAVIDDDPSNAYVRAKKPVKVSGDDEKQEITWAYTAPAVIKGFGDYLNKLYAEKLPEIKQQSEFFQNALEKDENTKKLLEKNGDNKLILSPASKEQTELITKQVETLKAKNEAAAETPVTEEAKPAVEDTPAVETPAKEESAPAKEETAPTPEPAPTSEEKAGVVTATVDAVVDVATSVGNATASTAGAVADVAVTTVSAVGDVAKATVNTVGDVASAVVDAVTPSKTTEEVPAATTAE